MESTRRSPPAADVAAGTPAHDEAPIVDAVRDAFARCAAVTSARAARVAVALSGGRDSMVLLDAAARVAPQFAVSLIAVHVHHGLSGNADAWARFCAEQCARRSVPLDVVRVAVARDDADGLEAAARQARYEALAAIDARAVLLAHHADDQAETLLLQLLRGAGPHGLAAMPASRIVAGATFLRPLLQLPRRALERYAAARALAWIDDESNDDRERTRNFIRHELAPQLTARFPGYPATLARAAMHQAEAARLVDELAALDAEGAVDGGALDGGRLASLALRAPHRARNLLRWFIRSRGLRAPSAARLAAMTAQIVQAAPDARVSLRHDGVEIGVYRGRVIVHRVAVAPFEVAWRGETRLPLPHGTLEFARTTGEGIAAALAQSDDVVVRSRAGGERLRLSARGERQTLKHLLQQAGVPHWERAALPLVFCGERLAAVPGIGVDAAFAAQADAPGYALHWRPVVDANVAARQR